MLAFCGKRGVQVLLTCLQRLVTRDAVIQGPSSFARYLTPPTMSFSASGPVLAFGFPAWGMPLLSCQTHVPSCLAGFARSLQEGLDVRSAGHQRTGHIRSLMAAHEFSVSLLKAENVRMKLGKEE